MQAKNILITGPPGIGKTVLIQRISLALHYLNPAGFYTEEIRVKGIRKGFSLVSLDGRTATLSHVDMEGRHRVGRYGVDVATFEDFLGYIAFFNPTVGIIIIDEIGKMECLSAKFKELLMTILDRERTVIATISRKGEDIIEEIKNRPDINLFVMTHDNRNSLLPKILNIIHAENA